MALITQYIEYPTCTEIPDLVLFLNFLDTKSRPVFTSQTNGLEPAFPQNNITRAKYLKTFPFNMVVVFVPLFYNEWIEIIKKNILVIDLEVSYVNTLFWSGSCLASKVSKFA